jgi:hypothetical protein
VLLEKKNAMTGTAEYVRSGHPCQPASDHDHIVLRVDPG